MKNNRNNKGCMTKIWLVMLCMSLLLTGCAGGAQPQFVMVSGTDRAGQTDGMCRWCAAAVCDGVWDGSCRADRRECTVVRRSGVRVRWDG